MDNAFGFRNAVHVGVNLRKGIDFNNCAKMGIHSGFQGHLFGKALRKDTEHEQDEWRVMPKTLSVIDTFKFNKLINGEVQSEMLAARWTQKESGTEMRLQIPDFSVLPSQFHGFKIWGGVRAVSLLRKHIYDSSDAETDILDSGSTGEIVFDFPKMAIEPIDQDDPLGDAVAIAFHWGFSTFIDGYPLDNKAMNGVFMRAGEV